MSQIAFSDVAVHFGATTVFRDVSLTVSRGERWGVVGRNGSGKTTFLNLLAGDVAPSAGTLTGPGDLRITLLDQHREFPEATTIWEAAASPFAELRELEASLARQAEALAEAGDDPPAEALERYDRDLERFAREGGYEMEARVDGVLQGLGFDPAEARLRPVGQLSGGEMGRVGLARQLAAPTDVLLLDEPTNHLDLDTIAWLEEYLEGLDATVMVVSHDRDFLERVVDHVLHFEARTAVPYSGGYSGFVRERARRRLERTRAFEEQQRTIEKEEEFIRRNIAGQKTNQAKSRRKALERMPRLSPPPTEEEAMALALQPERRGGDQVVVAEDVALRVGERTLLEGFDAVLRRGDVVGLVGANGTGKSTLLEAVAGLREPDAGELRVGDSIDLAYYRQDLTQIPLDKTLFDIIYDLRPQWDRGQVQGHLGRFGFSGDEVKRRPETLSGGERARVALAMLMLTRANLILLDEPTNHLDVESVEALEDALTGYPGTVLLVSHDRALLRALVTRVWSLEEGRIEDYPGSFSEWEAARQKAARTREQKAAEEQAARREKERRAAEETRRRTEGSRARRRTLRKEVEEAEAEVHRLEGRIDEVKDALADPELYADGKPPREAVELKQELAKLEADLARAMERWAEAGEALEETDAPA